MPYLVYGRKGGPCDSKQREFLEAGTETDVETETKELIRSALARRRVHENELLHKGRPSHCRVDTEGHEGHTRRRILFSSLPPTTYRYWKTRAAAAVPHTIVEINIEYNNNIYLTHGVRILIFTRSSALLYVI